MCRLIFVPFAILFVHKFIPVEVTILTLQGPNGHIFYIKFIAIYFYVKGFGKNFNIALLKAQNLYFLIPLENSRFTTAFKSYSALLKKNFDFFAKFLFKYQILDLKKQMQHLKTTIKSDIYNRPKKPHWKNWKIQHGGFKMATEIRKDPKKLTFFFVLQIIYSNSY